MSEKSKYLAEMIEEGLRRRPHWQGAEWVLEWLAYESDLPRARVRGIFDYELKQERRQKRL